MHIYDNIVIIYNNVIIYNISTVGSITSEF